MADLKISQFVDGDAVEPTDEIATNRGGVNTKVFVGSAASLDVGTGPNDIPQNSDLGSAAYENTGTSVGQIPVFEDDGAGGAMYPAGDGSQITDVVSEKIPVSATDTTPDFLDEKITVGNGLSKEIENPAGDENINIDIRRNTKVTSASSGTVTLDIDDGIAHELTVTGIVTLAAVLEANQSIIVYAHGFDDYEPFNDFDWGAAGVPVWSGSDHFIVYADAENIIHATLVMSDAAV